MQQRRESYRRPHKTAASRPLLRWFQRDSALLGINSVAELARRDTDALYREFCRKTRSRQDIFALDTFRDAVEQARNPKLPSEQCVWWDWSRVRKSSGGSTRNK